MNIMLILFWVVIAMSAILVPLGLIMYRRYVKTLPVVPHRDDIILTYPLV
jgi:hypothetical protein